MAKDPPRIKLVFSNLSACFAIVVSALVLNFSSAHANWFKQQQDIMGTRISVELWHKNQSLASQCSDKIFTEMHRLDAMMSPFKADSEISFINNNASTETIAVSDEIAEIIDKSEANCKMIFSRTMRKLREEKSFALLILLDV